MPDRYRRLAADSTGQLGSFTRRQAAAAGIGSAELRGQVQSGLLETFGARTLRPTLVKPTAAAELHAFVIDIGPPCWVSGPSAAALHRFDGFRLHRPYHLLIPRGRFVQRHNLAVHTSDTIDPIDVEELDGLPILSPVRTLVEIARSSSRARLTELIDGALRDGLISEDLLHRRIVALRTSGRPGIPRLLETLEGGEIVRGGHSWLERRFLRLVGEAGIPGLELNRCSRADEIDWCESTSISRGRPRRRGARLPLAPHAGADARRRRACQCAHAVGATLSPVRVSPGGR